MDYLDDLHQKGLYVWIPLSNLLWFIKKSSYTPKKSVLISSSLFFSHNSIFHVPHCIVIRSQNFFFKGVINTLKNAATLKSDGIVPKNYVHEKCQLLNNSSDTFGLVQVLIIHSSYYNRYIITFQNIRNPQSSKMNSYFTIFDNLE